MARAPSTGLAKRTPTSTAIVNWEEEMARCAVEASATEKMPGGSFLSVRSGILNIAGVPVKDNSLDVIIIDNVFENVFYPGKFDPEKAASPSCYAFGRDEVTLAPYKDATDPQSDACEGCDNNEWGTADIGKGKACKNSRRLALVGAAGMDAKAIELGEVIYFRLPVTSVRTWSMYVKGMANLYKRPPYGMVTRLSAAADKKTQFRVTLEPLGPVPAELLGSVMKRRQTVMDQIIFPYATAQQKTVKLGRGRGREAR